MLQQAGTRLEAGLPPTDDAEMEWAAMVRHQQTLGELKQQRDQVRGSLITGCEQIFDNCNIRHECGKYVEFMTGPCI